MFKLIGRPSEQRLGHLTEVFVQAYGPSSYDNTNKIAFDPAKDMGGIGLRSLREVHIDVEGAYSAEYDYTNKRVTVYTYNSTEVNNATDLSAVVFRIRVTGGQTGTPTAI